MTAREVAGRLYALPARELNWPALSEAERLRALVDAMDLSRATHRRT